ncbi:hypothetical protein HOE37_01110 [Candidatus Woesearchaeota archaeon]|jgi:hypothetical protein|nr:hypothetical protein [Candidatus Woesearchaeota archaeon]MBT4336041.1 hypothetical protein [Candidatus Woesearchaeota archaeon]MBT4468980.1 hypothetical protein [Candidatus Woesearchaeota archaeon]MBT6744701.1 hypothetical protein [Candidatus Woesearchaeota archaeon]
MKRKKRENPFEVSWRIVKNNKILFLPNLLILTVNLILVYLFLLVTGILDVFISSEYSLLKIVLQTPSSWIFLAIYVILVVLIDNYLLTAKYGMIKDILLKGKTDFIRGVKFANKHYLTTLGIHILSYLIIFVPLTLLGIVLFFLLPSNALLAAAIFLPVMLVYLVFISIRLLFVYPVMTFEKKGAYNSLKKDFHFVKTHGHQSLVTWLVVLAILIFVSVVKNNIQNLSELLVNQIYGIAIVVVTFILLIEISVSVWEHVYIFKSYLTAKKKK